MGAASGSAGEIFAHRPQSISENGPRIFWRREWWRLPSHRRGRSGRDPVFGVQLRSACRTNTLAIRGYLSMSARDEPHLLAFHGDQPVLRRIDLDSNVCKLVEEPSIVHLPRDGTRLARRGV